MYGFQTANYMKSNSFIPNHHQSIASKSPFKHSSEERPNSFSYRKSSQDFSISPYQESAVKILQNQELGNLSSDSFHQINSQQSMIEVAEIEKKRSNEAKLFLFLEEKLKQKLSQCERECEEIKKVCEVLRREAADVKLDNKYLNDLLKGKERELKESREKEERFEVNQQKKSEIILELEKELKLSQEKIRQLLADNQCIDQDIKKQKQKYEEVALDLIQANKRVEEALKLREIAIQEMQKMKEQTEATKALNDELLGRSQITRDKTFSDWNKKCRVETMEEIDRLGMKQLSQQQSVNRGNLRQELFGEGNYLSKALREKSREENQKIVKNSLNNKEEYLFQTPKLQREYYVEAKNLNKLNESSTKEYAKVSNNVSEIQRELTDLTEKCQSLADDIDVNQK